MYHDPDAVLDIETMFWLTTKPEMCDWSARLAHKIRYSLSLSSSKPATPASVAETSFCSK